MHSQDGDAVALGDPLQAAVEELLAAVPSFAGSSFLGADQVDMDSPHMIFEAFGRFLLDRLRERTEDGSLRAGFDFLNSVMAANRGAVAASLESRCSSALPTNPASTTA